MKPPEPYRSRIRAYALERIREGRMWYQRGQPQVPRVGWLERVVLDGAGALDGVHYSVEDLEQLSAEVRRALESL